MDYAVGGRRLQHIIWTVAVLLVFSGTARPQNCCAPAVPQQGVLGETVALPQTLEIGLHFEYLRARGQYEGDDKIDDPENRRTFWHRGTLTLGYGVLPGLSVTAIVPYVHKEKITYIPIRARDYTNESDGLGDITLLARYSPLARSFVNFRELSLGLGVKLPTGQTDRRNNGVLLPQELQPGTGSWDYQGSVSYYQGFEPVDFFASLTYIMTTKHHVYEFGDQFAYLLSSNFHVHPRLDLSAAISGSVRGKDRQTTRTATGSITEEVASTGRHQIWLVPGVQVQAVPGSLRLQTFLELPVYQHFDGIQVGSHYNLRLSLNYLLPLGSQEE